MNHPNLKRAYRDVTVLRRSALPVAVAAAVVRAIKPFVYVVFSARIVESLIASAGIKEISFISGATVLLSGTLLLLQYYLDNLTTEYADLCGMHEKVQITQKLNDAPFEVLERTELRKKLATHRNQSTMRGSIYSNCIWFVKQNTGSIISGLVAIGTIYYSILRRVQWSEGNYTGALIEIAVISTKKQERQPVLALHLLLF